MALVKALIINTETGLSIPVMFNPEEYSISKSAKFSDPEIHGLESPPTEYNRGSHETLSMELFFDTYEKNLDVRLHVEPLVKLLELNPQTDKPPVLLVAWGTLAFPCQLQSVTKKFTLFNSLGMPVRATLSVTFRGYNTLEFLLAKNPFRSLGHSKTYIVKDGETLSHIAWHVFQDASRWRVIARHNKLDNPKKLRPGQVPKIQPVK